MSKETALNQMQAAAQTTQETTPVETPAPAETKDDINSRRMAIFQKKEAALRKEREEWTKQREDFLKEKESIETIKKRAQEFDDLKTKDPIAALKLIGLSEADLFNILSQGQKPPDAAEIARRAAEEATKRLEEKFLQREEQAKEQTKKEQEISFKKQIAETIKSNIETSKFVNHYGSEGESLVLEFIEQNKQMGNDELSINEAIKMAEEYYRQEWEAQSQFAKKPEPQTQAAPKVEVKPKITTLNNKIAATAAAASTTIQKRESKDEKRARLESMLRSTAQ